jgi:hypothetical protein
MRPDGFARFRRDALVFAALLAAYLLLSSIVTNSYYQLMLTLVPIWAMMGLSWNRRGSFSAILG